MKSLVIAVLLLVVPFAALWFSNRRNAEAASRKETLHARIAVDRYLIKTGREPFLLDLSDAEFAMQLSELNELRHEKEGQSVLIKEVPGLYIRIKSRELPYPKMASKLTELHSMMFGPQTPLLGDPPTRFGNPMPKPLTEDQKAWVDAEFRRTAERLGVPPPQRAIPATSSDLAYREPSQSGQSGRAKT